jgi:hypothetical protein
MIARTQAEGLAAAPEVGAFLGRRPARWRKLWQEIQNIDMIERAAPVQMARKLCE